MDDEIINLQLSSENDQVYQYLESIFGEKRVTKETCLLEPKQSRLINEFELSEFNNISPNQKIYTSHRINYDSSIYHSSDYKKVGDKKCSFIVSYESQNNIKFGEIKYFLQIDNYYYVALSPMSKQSDSILKDVKIRLPDAIQKLKNEGLFDNIFFICEKTNEIFFMNIESIKNKCIIYDKNNI